MNKTFDRRIVSLMQRVHFQHRMVSLQAALQWNELSPQRVVQRIKPIDAAEDMWCQAD